MAVCIIHSTFWLSLVVRYCTRPDKARQGRRSRWHLTYCQQDRPAPRSCPAGVDLKKAVRAYLKQASKPIGGCMIPRVPPYKTATGCLVIRTAAGVFSANSPPVASLTRFRRQPPTFLTTLKANPSFLHSKSLVMAALRRLLMCLFVLCTVLLATAAPIDPVVVCHAHI